jgi:hypothetical protein
MKRASFDQMFGPGKTSLTNRFIRGQFDSQTKATVGATHLSKKLAINGITVKLNLVRSHFSLRARALIIMLLSHYILPISTNQTILSFLICLNWTTCTLTVGYCGPGARFKFETRCSSLIPFLIAVCVLIFDYHALQERFRSLVRLVKS